MASWVHVAVCALLIRQTLSQSTSPIAWLSDADYNSFKSSFLNLDYNKDGSVTLNEAKLGVLSILDADYLATQTLGSDGEFSDAVYAQYHTFQPSKYNCIASLIAVLSLSLIGGISLHD